MRFAICLLAVILGGCMCDDTSGKTDEPLTVPTLY